ncbi:hypothetical protein QE364_001755 [Nocardioides zeae]|uniref:Uncharacterized protein n=2 Tax=Nocardioides zeae TaxID=1457234 RepID=A0ACC6IH19_9ACTN|nr:hypothetical protein [Nocardioides zeae]MDQ1103226.1 hypothetical protein [Nocardioides zeae]MDR6173055.1 hypothetical protein [Nocardioides zeae]MDR6210048.1 hypothetical protein [Nocardioides zeae]
MNRGADDEAWRAIVENYGDRAELDDTWDTADAAGPPESPESPEDAGTPGGDEPDAARSRRPEPEERYVPPPPPPLPRPAPPRLAAWTGVLGMPVLVLVLIVLQIAVPPWATTGMVLWFLSGFAYLVASMPAQRPDDGDDGARV